VAPLFLAHPVEVDGIAHRHQCLLLFAVPGVLLRNVALNKTSFQVSTYADRFGEHSASLANDGSRQTDFSVCAASDPTNYPWWAVDLDVPTLVYQVTFTNRGDATGNSTTLAYFVSAFCVSLIYFFIFFYFVTVIVFLMRR